MSIQRELEGREYYDFEFAAKANTYIRHALASVTVGNGEAAFLPAGIHAHMCMHMHLHACYA